MKKIVDLNTPTYSVLISKVLRTELWSFYPYQERFKEFFFYDHDARSLFETIRSTTCYQSPDEDILRRICTNNITDDEWSKVYDYFRYRQLWNPFSVLIGTQKLHIFPYKLSRLTYACNLDYRSVKYSKKNNLAALYMGIHIARLLKTFLCVPNVNRFYKLELSPSHLRSPYNYNLSYDNNRNVFTIGYGAMGLEFGYRFDSLLVRLEKQINENLTELFLDCPLNIAWTQREQVRKDYCSDNIDHSFFNIGNYYQSKKYPFYYSLITLHEFEIYCQRNVPFQILKKVEE